MPRPEWQELEKTIASTQKSKVRKFVWSTRAAKWWGWYPCRRRWSAPKILDYGKFKYEAQKKASAARKKQRTIDVKEIKMRPNIDSNDYNIKMRKIHEFLSDGDKVKVTLRFRGRELAHQDLAMNLLERVRDELGDQAKVEQFPKMEGRQMVMIMAPPK
jgi:translation initiation factor IF-3